MDSITDSVNTSTSGFVSRVANVSTLTKNKVMNATQFIAFGALPIASIDMLSKHLFSNSNPEEKGSVELFIEIVIQLIYTILLVTVVSKIIYEIPTYSGMEIAPLNYINLSLGYLIGAFSGNHCNITDKYLVIAGRLNESWSGKKNIYNKNKQNDNVSVSKPISGILRQAPVHQNSRADVGNTMDQAMSPPIVPNGSPAPPPEFHNNKYNQNTQPENSITGNDDLSSQEPIAANSGGGGFSSW
tara:strand:+ start:12115 stop:12843 length:729 start_codon:yes stop_codon:yes gene_type:complete